MKTLVTILLFICGAAFADPGITIDVDIFIHRPHPNPESEIHR